MSSKIPYSEMFEQAISYPDPDYFERYNLLVGLDDTKVKLEKIISLLVDPNGLAQWAKKFHPEAKSIISTVSRRPPLIVLAGDVGSGKSELALTVGDAVARLKDIEVTLFPLSLSTRGQGRVGEMTQLISGAFDLTISEAKKLKSTSGAARGAIILLIDEADALAQSRENNQMHHEDKAGVNAFIRGVDSVANSKIPAVIIMCTNRPNALDPAIKRRAAEIIYFNRPNYEQRLAVLLSPLSELGLSKEDIKKVTELTGDSNERKLGFTYSDITQRLLPAIVMEAYPKNAVNPEKVILIAESMMPTSPFNEQ